MGITLPNGLEIAVPIQYYLCLYDRLLNQNMFFIVFQTQPKYNQATLNQLWKQLANVTSSEEHLRCLNGIQRRIRACVRTVLVTPENFKVGIYAVRGC